MNIYNIFITLVLVVIAAFGVILGIKKGVKRSALSLASNVLAALSAFGLARLVSARLGQRVGSALSDRLVSSVARDTAGILRLPEISAWYLTAGRVITGVAAFALFYLAFFLLLKIPIGIIVKKFPDGGDGNKTRASAVSPILRVLSGLMTFILLLSPAAALCGALDGGRIDSYKYASAAPAKEIQKVADYPVVKAASAVGGRAFFDALTVFDDGGVHINPSDEIGYAAEFAFNSYDIFSFERTDADETESSLLKIDGALNGSALLAPSMGAAVPYMASQWLEGKSCMGIKVNIPKGRAGILVRRLLEKISGWSAEEVIRDFSLLAELMKLLQGKELNADASARELLNAFADREYAKEIFTSLSENPDFKEIIPDIVYSGVGMALDEIGAKLPENYSSDALLSSLTKAQAEDEAVIFSNIAAAVSDIYTSNDSLKPALMTQEQQAQLTDAVSGIRDSLVLDETTAQNVIDGLEEAFYKLQK
ncbi:MAG: hypothetical protein NC223_10240 [Butyrivibrio sp.]|nr:hypothetical protein [Butyrivibrio sp.]